MKKILKTVLSLVSAVALVVGFASCEGGKKETGEIEMPAYDVVNEINWEGVTIPEDFKFGLITLHDANSTYDANFINAFKDVVAKLGLKDSQYLISSGIAESDACYDKAIEFANAGCDVIFADSFGHETYLLKAAKEKTNVLFSHATGTMAHTENLDNFCNAFASIYEGRYLAGVAAGMKLNEMIESGKITADKAVMGYVGAFTYAEVMSGYSSFYLGAKSVCPSVTMKVTFTGSWYDETAEKNAAYNLINQGCVLISQHADSWGAPTACEEKGVPNVSYNGSTYEAGPNTFIVSSRINWAPYFEYLIYCKVTNAQVKKDYVGTIKNGSVVLSNLGPACAEGTVEQLVDLRNKLANGTLNVFDCTKDNYMLVGGQKLTEYMADVDTDAAFTKDTQVVINGIFQESNPEFRSAPYFDVELDGITLLDRNYGD